MTTDTAVRVTRLIVQDKGTRARPNESDVLMGSIVALDKIDYVDYPELRINKNESTEMPFRYVKGSNGEPIMPEASLGSRVGATTVSLY